MRKLLLLLFLALIVVFSATVAIKRRFYVYASADTQSVFFKVFDVRPQIAPFMRRRCFSWQSDGGQPGWRSATHVREFHEDIVIKDTDWPVLTADLQRTLSGQLSVNGSHVLRSFGDPETVFGFDYGEGNTLGTVSVYPAKMAAGCFECASVASGEVAVKLDVFIREERNAARPSPAMVEEFIRGGGFEKIASRAEDSLLASDFSRATKSHADSCAEAIRAKLLAKGITLSQDPRDATQVVMNNSDGYFGK